MEERIGNLGLADANYYTQDGKTTGSYRSTGNYHQYPVINHNEKEYEKYIFITESNCCTAEINTTLLTDYTSIKLKAKCQDE